MKPATRLLPFRRLAAGACLAVLLGPVAGSVAIAAPVMRRLARRLIIVEMGVSDSPFAE